MKKLHCYNNICCSLNISKIRLKCIEATPRIKRSKEDIEQVKLEIKLLTEKKKIIESTLAKLTGIELELFKSIVINNMNTSQAIPYISETQYISESSLWRNYYSKIKNDIEKIKLEVIDND